MGTGIFKGVPGLVGDEDLVAGLFDVLLNEELHLFHLVTAALGSH